MDKEPININDAGQVVIDAETAALKAIKSILDNADAELGEVEATLPNNIRLDAANIIKEVRQQFAYRRNSDIPSILSRYTNPTLMEYVPPPIV